MLALTYTGPLRVASPTTGIHRSLSVLSQLNLFPEISKKKGMLLTVMACVWKVVDSLMNVIVLMQSSSILISTIIVFA